MRASGAGTVAFAGRVAGRMVVSLQHLGGLRTTYEPVTPSLPVGRHVERGEIVGHLDAVGSHCPPEACLHWGVRRGGDYFDPLLLLAPPRARLLPLGPVARRSGEIATPEAGRARTSTSQGNVNPSQSDRTGVDPPGVDPPGVDRSRVAVPVLAFAAGLGIVAGLVLRL